MASSIKVTILGDAGPLMEAFGKAEASAEGFGRSMSTVLKAGAVAAAAGIGIATVAIDKSVKAALEAEGATSKLNQSFKNAGLSAQAYSKQIDAAESSGRKLGFTNEDTQQSLARLVTATGNVSSATKDMSVAQNLARFKGIDLSSATQMITSAMTGGQRAIKDLGIAVIPTTTNVQALRNAHYDLTTAAGQAALAHAKLLDKLSTGNAVIDAVNAKVHGMASAYASGASGGLAQFHAQLSAVEVSLGEGLLPTLAKAAGGLADFLGKINDAKGFGAKMGVILSGLVSLANDAWNALKQAFAAVDWGAVWDGIKTSMVDGIATLRQAFAALPTIATDAYNGLKTAFDAVDWGAVWSNLWSLWKQELTTLAQFGTEIYNALKTSLNSINWHALFESTGSGLAQFGKDLGAGLVATLNKLGSVIGSVNWASVGQALIEGFEAAIALLAKFLAGVDWIKVIGAIFTAMRAIIKANIELMAGLFETLGKQILKGIEAGLSKVGEAVKDSLSGLGNDIENATAGAWKGIETGALNAALVILKALDFKVLGKHVIPGVNSLVGGIEAELAKIDVKTPLVKAMDSAKSAAVTGGGQIGAALAGAIAAALAGTNTGHGAGTDQPTGTGAVPNQSPSSALTNVGAFSADLISALGGNPKDQSTLSVLKRWQAMEGGSTNNTAAYNFLNTTLREPGSSSINSVGVQAYGSFKQGLQATISTLQHGYPAIINAIATGNWTPTQELASELSKWSGGGYSSIIGSAGAGAGAGTGAGGGGGGNGGLTKKPVKQAGGLNLLPASEISAVKAAAADVSNALKRGNTKAIVAAYTAEENLIKKEQTDLQAKAGVGDAKEQKTTQEAIGTLKASLSKIQEDIAATFAKAATKDEAAAKSDASKATSAFAKGQFGPAESYVTAEIKSLTAAKDELEKALAAAPKAEKAAYQKDLKTVEAQLKDLKGATAWIGSVGEILKDFAAKLKTEGAAYTALLQQKSAAAALSSAGFFRDTPQVVATIDSAIVANLEQQKTTAETALSDLQAKLKTAPASLKAGLNTQIKGIESKVTSLTTSITSAMGTVENELASAVQDAQSKLQTAVSSLQGDLDNQIQTLAENASGFTADNATLQSMQAADQLKGYTDALSASQKQLATDTAAGSDATADQIQSDKEQIAAAQRALDEYNLSVKVQGENATATATATKNTNALNTQLAGFEADLLSGKITAAEFQQDLAGLQKTFGVTINDTVTPELVGVASAASLVTKAFDALITWIDKTSGAPLVPLVGGGYPDSVTGVGGNIVTTGGSGVSITGSGLGGNIALGGFAAGGIVPSLHALQGMIVPGVQKTADYVPALLNGGEMVLNGAQQSNLWGIVNSRGGGGQTMNFHFPNYVGDKRELIQMLRTEFSRMSLRGTSLYV